MPLSGVLRLTGKNENQVWISATRTTVDVSGYHQFTYPKPKSYQNNLSMLLNERDECLDWIHTNCSSIVYCDSEMAGYTLYFESADDLVLFRMFWQ